MGIFLTSMNYLKLIHCHSERCFWLVMRVEAEVFGLCLITLSYNCHNVTKMQKCCHNDVLEVVPFLLWEVTQLAQWHGNERWAQHVGPYCTHKQVHFAYIAHLGFLPGCLVFKARVE